MLSGDEGNNGINRYSLYPKMPPEEKVEEKKGRVRTARYTQELITASHESPRIANAVLSSLRA